MTRYEELDAAADKAADEQYRLLTEYTQLRESGSPDQAAEAAAAYDAAVEAAGPIYEALAGYQDEDGPGEDPAVVAAAAIERERAEELAQRLAEQDMEYVMELELGR